jgi:hypothetical protein
MFCAYFDESGDSQDTDFLAMAACIAPDAAWKEFNRRWREHLAACGAPYLHMREFAHSSGAYKGWPDDRRKDLLGGCLDALNGLQIVMAATAMRVADFRRLSEQMQVELVDPAFCCFQDCLFSAQLYAYLGQPGSKTDVVYSQQKDFRRKLQLLFDYYRQYSKDPHTLGSLQFENMRDVPALQLADLVAYELRAYFQKQAQVPGAAMRYPFKRLCEHQIANQLAMFRFVPEWQLQFQAAGIWRQANWVIWDDLDMWGDLITDTCVPNMASRSFLLSAQRVHKERRLERQRELVQAALKRKPS